MAKPTMDDSAYYVYVLFRHDTAEPFYVGKGKGRRWEQHQSLPKSDGNRHKKSIIQLARAAGKSVPVVFVGEVLTEPQAFDVERAFIKAIGRRANGGPLVNMTDGGEGASGVECSAETREKRRVNSTGRKFGPKTPEQRARLSAAKMGVPNTARLGHVVTEETRAKISASKKGVKIPALAGHAVTEDTRQKLRAASTGKSLSAETRAKLSDAGKRHEFTPEFISAFVERNRVRMLAGHSPETCAKISAAKKGTKLTDEHKAKVSKALRNRGPVSEETRKKLSSWQVGRVRTEDAKQKMREGWARRKALLSQPPNTTRTQQ